MKKMILLAFVALNFCAFGQNFSEDFDVSLGEPYAVVDGKHKAYIPLEDGTLISIKTRGEIVTVQKYDANSLKELSRNSYEDFPEYNKVQGIVETSEGMFYVYEAYNKPEKTFSLYARKVDTDNGVFISNDKLFTTTRPVTGQDVNADGKYSILVANPMMIGRFGCKFRITQSFDKSKVLVQYRNKPIEKDDKLNHDMIGYYVFDSSMKLLVGNEVKMPHTEADINNLAYAVDRKGNAYSLIFLREEKKFSMLVVDIEGELKELPLGIDGDLTFQRLSIIEDYNGHIRCAGIFANGYDIKFSMTKGLSASFNANGIVTFGIDPTGEVTHENIIEFPVDMLGLYLNDKQRKKLAKREEDGKAGIEDLKMVDLVAQKDGSLILVCEQEYLRDDVFFFTNMVMAKVNENGELDWMTKMPKNQYGKAGYSWEGPYFRGQMSLKYMHGETDHYLMFIDNPKNENLSKTDIPEKHVNGAGGFLTAFQVSDEDGSFKRHTLADVKDIQGKTLYQFDVTRICEMEDGAYVLEAYLKGKEDGLVSIKLK